MVEQQPAYIIHTRAFRDSSLLVEVITQDCGRLSLVAKGARQPKSHQRHLLQPFVPVNIWWQGRSSLKTLTQIEARSEPINLVGKCLFSGFYVNELLNYLLVHELVLPGVFSLYETLLPHLHHEDYLDINLRQFEFSFLQELGYGIDFFRDETGLPIGSEQYYQFVPQRGFSLACDGVSGPAYPGHCLLAIGQEQYNSKEIRLVAKSITRNALDQHLQGKTIKSRELFK